MCNFYSVYLIGFEGYVQWQGEQNPAQPDSSIIPPHACTNHPATTVLPFRAANNLELQDICRCMVGAWPTHIDLDLRGGEYLQALVDGVLQALPALPPPSANSVGAPPGIGGGGSGSGGGSGAPGLCTGVVFRGRIGGDRAVRANVPFPWMGTMQRHSSYTTFEPGEKEFSLGCVVKASLSQLHPAVRMHYPCTFLARVKADAPFAWLWPGHAGAKGREDVGGAPAEDDCGGVGGVGGGGGRAAAAATGDRGGGSSSGTAGGSGAGSDRDEELLRPERERVPSSGPTPFFHAGYTAYFEITLEKTLAPLEQPRGEELDMEQCVAIGLADDSFNLE